MAPAPTTEEATRKAAGPRPGPVPDGRLDARSTSRHPRRRYTAYTEGDLFRVSVPSNWRELPRQQRRHLRARRRVRKRATGRAASRTAWRSGSTRNETHDLRTATDELVASLARSNPNLSRPSATIGRRIGGRQGLRTVMSNVSDATGQQERIAVFTDAARRREPLLRARGRSARPLLGLRSDVPQSRRIDPDHGLRCTADAGACALEQPRQQDLGLESTVDDRVMIARRTLERKCTDESNSFADHPSVGVWWRRFLRRRPQSGGGAWRADSTHTDHLVIDRKVVGRSRDVPVAKGHKKRHRPALRRWVRAARERDGVERQPGA